MSFPRPTSFILWTHHLTTPNLGNCRRKVQWKMGGAMGRSFWWVCQGGATWVCGGDRRRRQAGMKAWGSSQGEMAWVTCEKVVHRGQARTAPTAEAPRTRRQRGEVETPVPHQRWQARQVSAALIFKELPASASPGQDSCESDVVQLLSASPVFLYELLCDLSDSAAFRGVFHRSSASVVLPGNRLAGTGSAFNPVHRLLT